MRSVLVLSFILVLSVFALGQQKPGQAAQNFVETTISGESIELEKLRGKVVVLTFWSTRCEICVAEIPNLNKLVDKYGTEDVVWVGLAWQDKAKLEEFFAKKPFKFKIVAQSLGVLLKYADRDPQGRLNMGFPAHFIVSQDGTVVYKASGWDKTSKIDSTVSRLLSDNVAKVD
ncbi:MAG: TlpA family protein disulfide reductase [Acidobacteriota bacterium]|nr:MAG: TlpA family protein disulfide reductase [Acidobacteriota bacterium]